MNPIMKFIHLMGSPPWFYQFSGRLIPWLWGLFVVLAAASLWLLYRYYHRRDPLFWMLTSSGVLLIASWP